MKSIKVSAGISTTAILAAIIIVLYIKIGPGSQIHNLKIVNNWLEEHEQEIEKLKDGNPELKSLNIYAWTGGNGTIGITIDPKISDSSRLVLYDWIFMSNPPRPIYLDRRLYDRSR